MFVEKYLKLTFILLLIMFSEVISAKQPLQLAVSYRQELIVKDYLISEKLDGVRGRWDGYRMWSKQGNEIHLPEWFSKGFPETALDGELWIARERFEIVSGMIQSKYGPNSSWKKVKYMVFDVPKHKGTFEQRYAFAIEHYANLSPYLKVIEQFTLSSNDELMSELDKRVRSGAEGLMLHKADSLYVDGRNSDLIKLKQYYDAEAKVIAYYEGKGKFQGMLGSLLVEMPNGKQFKIGSGFTLKQRKNPPPLGSIITYKYFGLTAKKTPRFASFLRVRFPSETIQASDKNDKIH